MASFVPGVQVEVRTANDAHARVEDVHVDAVRERSRLEQHGRTQALQPPPRRGLLRGRAFGQSVDNVFALDRSEALAEAGRVGNVDEGGSALAAVGLGVRPVNGLVGDRDSLDFADEVVVQELHERAFAVVVFEVLAEALRPQTRAFFADFALGSSRPQAVGAQVSSVGQRLRNLRSALVELDQLGDFVVEVRVALLALRTEVVQVVLVREGRARVAKLDRLARRDNVGPVRVRDGGFGAEPGLASHAVHKAGVRESLLTWLRFWWEKPLLATNR